MPPRRNIRDEDWERLSSTIRKLYLEEDRSMKDVLLILGTFHGFYPSKAQLEGKLKQWHLTKNMAVMDWKYVGNEIRRRKCRGKESKVYLSGIPLRAKAIERGLTRYCYETAIEKAMQHVPEPPMPEDQPILVCTPAPQEMHWPCRLDNIPWILSRRLVEDLAIQVPSHLRMSYQCSDSSFQGLVDSIMFPRFDLQSYTTLLRTTFQTLRSIMPEEYNGAHAIRAQDLLQKGRSDTVNAKSLVCLVFLLSNDLFQCRSDFGQQERYVASVQLLLRLFRESGSNVLAKGQYSRLLPSLQSSLDGLFREAIKTSDLDAVALLLQAGVDVDTTFSDPPDLYYGNFTALQHAARSNQHLLLQVLIGHRANTQRIDIETLAAAWQRRRVAKGSPEETMKILLSIYRFRPEDEIYAVRLLFMMSQTASTSSTEAIIQFFRSNLAECSPAAKAQLLITAIRTNSRLIDDLVVELGHFVNSCGYYPETPMTAAVYEGDVQLCRRLLHSGATFEPGHEAPTPLQWAASFSDISMVRRLLDWGADVNFCHPHPTLLRVAFEDVTSMRFSYTAEILWEHRSEQRHLNGSLGRTALQAALLGGNADTALYLLTAGAKLVGGELVMAIWNRQFEIIKSLLDSGASFQDECTIFAADTVLEAAILSENTDLVHKVIADNIRSVTGQALCASVFLASMTRDFTTLQDLLSYTSQLLGSEDVWVGTAMCLGAYLGCEEIPQMMLNSGLHPQTSWPLLISTLSHVYKPLKNREQSPSDGSVTRRYLNWLRASNTNNSRRQLNCRRPIMEVAVSSGCLEFVELLVNSGYQPGPDSSIGITCHSISLDALRRLHGLGIQMTERVLTEAIKEKQSRGTIDWLLSVGVDINERSDRLENLSYMIVGVWFPLTPLQAAVNSGDIDLVHHLIECGADVNEPPYHLGQTSLQIAAGLGHFGIVQRLLEMGADPNAPETVSLNLQGHTAIESAAQRGRLDVVQLLLNSGAETSGCGRRQFVRSVAFAQREGHHTIVRLLKSHAGWTKADEDLLSQKDFMPAHMTQKIFLASYVRGYYGEEFDGEGPARGVPSKEDQPLDDAKSNTGESQASDEVESDSGEHTSNSEVSQTPSGKRLCTNVDTSVTWLASNDTAGRAQELIEGLDEPSDAFLLNSTPTSCLPNAYEALSEEFGSEFLPSSMSYQIREELEGDGCLEESGGDLWAEEYSRFIQEIPIDV